MTDLHDRAPLPEADAAPAEPEAAGTNPIRLAILAGVIIFGGIRGGVGVSVTLRENRGAGDGCSDGRRIVAGAIVLIGRLRDLHHPRSGL